MLGLKLGTIIITIRANIDYVFLYRDSFGQAKASHNLREVVLSK